MELTESFDTADGAVRWGRIGSGPPVVLVHGTPFSSVVWHDLAHGLAHRHEVYVWDLLGFGRSDMHEGQDVSLAAQGRILADLLTHWDLPAPTVIAHDIGGATALRAALLHEASYRRLALFDPVALAPWGSPFFTLAGDHRAEFEQIPQHLHEAMVHAYIGTATHRGLTGHDAAELARPWLGDVGRAAFYRQIAQADQAHTDEVENRYGELDLPVWIGWGDSDSWIPPSRGPMLAGRIPGATVRTFRDAGHLVQFDAPAQLATWVGEVLG